MAISKVTYDGNTLIDLTNDTAVASDVLAGKTFHLADGSIATGVNTGGITPTGTINITSNGSHDVTSYATASVNVAGGSATFGRSVDITITFDNTIEEGETFDLDVCYRGSDPNSPQNVIWKTERYTFTDAIATVTKTIHLCPEDAPLLDGIYVPVGDGGTTSNISSLVNANPQYMEMTIDTGSEHVYVTIKGNTASFTVYYSNL